MGNTVELIIGFTRSNRFRNYFPMSDGWRVEAEQDRIVLDYPDYMETAHEVAERVFIATNAPEEAIARVQSQRELADMLAEYAKAHDAEPSFPGLRALSVGDTVTYDGHTLACDRIGWRDVTAEIDEYELSLGAALAREADVEVERA